MQYYCRKLCSSGFSSGFVVMIMNAWDDDKKHGTKIDRLCYLCYEMECISIIMNLALAS